MTKKYESLPTIPLNKNNTYSHPPLRPELVYLSDPAVDVMLDFSQVNPLTAAPHNPIDEADVDMKSSGTHIMLVVEEERVVGVVSSEDILGEKPMKIIQERRVKRSEIMIKGVMTPSDQLMAIDYQELRHAKVGHLLNTLTTNKQHYALIVDTQENSDAQTVHGLVYIYDIIRRLEADKDLPSELREARSILELQNKLR